MHAFATFVAHAPLDAGPRPAGVKEDGRAVAGLASVRRVRYASARAAYTPGARGGAAIGRRRATTPAA
ncbi:MAG: hypothetical protein D6689_07160 [Deltaproteobacteria bacterium]|nr:MAG: hypothetical protein D6689_07160 [Deltaproteobacteria bacterium]